jgi:hypothetical protein
MKWMTILLLSVASSAMALQPPPKIPLTTVGTEGVVHVHSAHDLEALEVNAKSTVIVRIDAKTLSKSGGFDYELHYIANRPGIHDLTQYIRRTDGGKLAMSKVSIDVRTTLPKGHQGNLSEIDQPAVPSPMRYRLWMGIAGAVWVIPMLALWIRRRWLNRPKPEPHVEPPLTLADQLRPLVGAAIEGELNVDQQAKLERLLVAFWRERLGLGSLDPRDAWSRLRKHNEAGALVNQLERWLHQRPNGQTVDVAALLEPYRHHAPIETSLQGVGS